MLTKVRFVRRIFVASNAIQTLDNKTAYLMDHSPIRQTFELGKFIGTAGKSIINLAEFEVWLKNIVKYSHVKFANFIYFCITSHFIFHISRYFSTKLHNFTKFMMLFPAVPMNFSNSEVCLIREWSVICCLNCIPRDRNSTYKTDHRIQKMADSAKY